MGFFSGFGFAKLRKEYSEKVQENPQDMIKCKLYFTHAFNCMVMGYVELVLKVCELILYVIVMAFKLVMRMFPWR